jgi:FG-GAP-like repeat
VVAPSLNEVGDFNGDGILDLALTDYFAGTVSVLPGTGAGAFSAGSKLDLMRGSIFDMATADFDGDGFVDLAVQSATNDQNEWKTQGVTFLKGLGNGTFGAPRWLPMGDGFSGRMTRIDLVGDGKVELLASNSSAIFQLMFADGGSSASSVLSSTPAVYWPASGDFNGDHAQDLAVELVDPSNATRIAIYVNGCP